MLGMHLYIDERLDHVLTGEFGWHMHIHSLSEEDMSWSQERPNWPGEKCSVRRSPQPLAWRQCKLRNIWEKEVIKEQERGKNTTMIPKKRKLVKRDYMMGIVKWYMEAGCRKGEMHNQKTGFPWESGLSHTVVLHNTEFGADWFLWGLREESGETHVGNSLQFRWWCL